MKVFFTMLLFCMLSFSAFCQEKSDKELTITQSTLYGEPVLLISFSGVETIGDMFIYTENDVLQQELHEVELIKKPHHVAMSLDELSFGKYYLLIRTDKVSYQAPFEIK